MDGEYRYGYKHIQFLYIALGSLSELETQLLIAYNIGYLKKSTHEEFNLKIVKLIKMISSLINHIKENKETSEQGDK